MQSTSGRAWLDALPARIDSYSRHWSLTPQAIADSGAMSCCVYCTTADGTAAVLKIPVDSESGNTEVQLLQLWSESDATPRILDQDNGSGVFLMTRIVPGTIAWPVEGRTDADRFGDLLTRLNHPGSSTHPTLKDLADIAGMRMDWARDRFADPQYSDDMEKFSGTERLEKAQRILDTLLDTSTQQHVLHADLQAKNILQGPDHWHTIDPLGAVGDNQRRSRPLARHPRRSGIHRRSDRATCPAPAAGRNTAARVDIRLLGCRVPSVLDASAKRMAAFVATVDTERTIETLRRG